MADPYHLQRFIDAQDRVFQTALQELNTGSKRSHWMWFIFPQLTGLGRSPTAIFYGLATLAEARAYLDHPILGPRLRQCVEAIGHWAGRRTAEQILGPVDAVKLRSCLTLFDQVAPNGLFARGLGDFYAGHPDDLTLALLNGAA